MANTSGSLSFSGVDPISGALEFEVQINHQVTDEQKDLPLVQLIRLFGSGARKGNLDVELPNGKVLSNSSSGIVEVKLDFDPVSTTDNLKIWLFTVRIPPKSPKGDPEFLRLTLSTLPNDKFLQQLGKIFNIATQFNQAQPVKVAIVATGVPRLCIGINEGKPDPVNIPVVGDPDLARVHDLDGIRKIALEVAARLFDPNGLMRAWEHQSNLNPAFALSAKAPTIQHANELWARQVTEMLMATSYGRPINIYQKGVDHDYCAANIQKGSSNPFYGLSFACEHLASFGSASRGLQTFPDHIEAGAAAASAWSKATPAGKWFAGETDPTEATNASSGKPTALTPVQHGAINPQTGDAGANVIKVEGFFKVDSADASFGPGSVMLFSNRPSHQNEPAAYNQLLQSNSTSVRTFACIKGASEQCIKFDPIKLKPKFTGPFRVLTSEKENNVPLLADHTAGAHIGFVLRVSSDKKKIQPFDTGALGATTPKGDRGGGQVLFPANNGFHSGNFDDPATDKIKSTAAEPFRGFGVMPKVTQSDAQKILNHVQNILQKARPLGLARFVLIERNKSLGYASVQKFRDGWLKFMSPVIPMYSKKDTDNFSLSRFFWSLREMPGKDLTGMWFIYSPREEFAEAMKNDTNRSSVKDLLTQAFSLAQASRKRMPKKWGTSSSPNLTQMLSDMTIPILNCASQPDGRVKILNNNYNNYGRMHRLHHLEGRFGNPLRLPMDQAFLFDKNASLANFPEYMIPPGTTVFSGG